MARYIDADGLIRVMKSFKTYMKAEESEDVIKGLEKAINCVDGYADEFQHTGKWLKCGNEGLYLCSHCLDYQTIHHCTYRFCPHCGAKMVFLIF